MSAITDSPEGQLSERNRRLNDEFFNRTHAGIVYTVISDGYAYADRWNPAFVEMFGWNEEELTAMNLIDLVHPDDRNLIIEFTRDVINGDNAGTDRTYEIRCVRKDGNIFWANSNVFVSDESKNGEITTCSMIQDITDIRILEERNIHLQLLQDTLMDTVASITHDVRSPLGASQANLEAAIRMLEKGSGTSEILVRLDRARYANRVIQDQLGDLDSIKELIEGKMYLHSSSRQLQDLELMLLQLTELYRTGAESKNIEMLFETTVPHAKYSTGIILDSVRIETLAINLIGNAIKYTHEGSVKVKTSIDQQRNAYVFEISDTGIGIPDGESDRIWKMFERCSNTKGFKGSGIGLARCKAITDLHDGHIEVESVEGESSTFRVYLPLSSEVWNS